MTREQAIQNADKAISILLQHLDNTDPTEQALGEELADCLATIATL